MPSKISNTNQKRPAPDNSTKHPLLSVAKLLKSASAKAAEGTQHYREKKKKVKLYFELFSTPLQQHPLKPARNLKNLAVFGALQTTPEIPQGFDPLLAAPLRWCQSWCYDGDPEHESFPVAFFPCAEPTLRC